MPTPPDLAGAVGDLARWFKKFGAQGVVVGGIAACLLGQERRTDDLDAMALVDQRDWGRFLEAGMAFGFEPRVDDPIAFATRSRVLLLVHSPTDIPVDLSLGLLPFEEEAVCRAHLMDIAGVTVPVVSPDDLIVMKALAMREKDRLDIETMVELYPDMDFERILRIVGEMARLLELPGIIDDLWALLKRLGH